MSGCLHLLFFSSLTVSFADNVPTSPGITVQSAADMLRREATQQAAAALSSPALRREAKPTASLAATAEDEDMASLQAKVSREQEKIKSLQAQDAHYEQDYDKLLDTWSTSLEGPGARDPDRFAPIEPHSFAGNVDRSKPPTMPSDTFVPDESLVNSNDGVRRESHSEDGKVGYEGKGFASTGDSGADSGAQDFADGQVGNDAAEEHALADRTVPKAVKTENGVPVGPAFNGGRVPDKKHDLRFEYQAAIGRDGYEPDPIRPASEYFGPFRINYHDHSIILENWNLAIKTDLQRYGMGNFVVGNANNIKGARNSAIMGNHNTMRGSYGFVAGDHNTADGTGAVVAGGQFNEAKGEFANVNGGSKNKALAKFSVVMGGHRNRATAPYSVVDSGIQNIADGYSSTVTAGRLNFAQANISAVNGGRNNTVPPHNVSAVVEGGNNKGWPKPTPGPEVTVKSGEAEDPGMMIKCDSGKEGPCLQVVEKEMKMRKMKKHKHTSGGWGKDVRRRRSAPKK